MPAAPLLVAIVGGSGSGKTWLAERLKSALGRSTARLSLDDFYRDRSRLSPARRVRINFDHPRAIDWPAFDRVLRRLQGGQGTRAPVYDFNTHCRISTSKAVRPARFVLIDGLWLLRRSSVRRMFGFRIFLECPPATRLRRRLARDRLERGRTRDSIRAQFLSMVEPMHIRYVQPQARWADAVLSPRWGDSEVSRLAAQLRLLPAEVERKFSRER